MKWFGSLGLFLHEYEDSRRIPKYEMRTTICHARSVKAAKAKFLKEFADYAQHGIRFLNEWEIFEIDGVPGRIPIEAAHQLITTDLSSKEFIKEHWFGDRPKSCKDKGWTHSWHNVDGTHSGCYNCRAIRKGRLWEMAVNKRPQ